MNLGWIWPCNLRPRFTELAMLENYQFDDSDWLAIGQGVIGTDSEAGRWFSYPVGSLTIWLALEPGADEMISVKVDGAEDDPERQQIGWLAGITRNWQLSDPRDARNQGSTAI